MQVTLFVSNTAISRHPQELGLVLFPESLFISAPVKSNYRYLSVNSHGTENLLGDICISLI